MTEDLNTVQSVTEPDLEAEVVVQPDLNTDADSVDQQNQDVLADGTTPDKTVKYSELQKQVEARKAAEEQAAFAQRQLELMAQQQQFHQAQQPAARLTNEEQALQDLNLSADDLYGSNIVEYTKRLNQINYAQYQQSQEVAATQQFIASHPDVGQAVGSINPATGQLVNVSPELAAILTKKPYLIGACNTLSNAYQVVLDERRLANVDTQTTEQKAANIQRKVDVATAPLGGSAAGGGGGNGSSQGTAMLSREQVAQIDADIAAGKYS